MPYRFVSPYSHFQTARSISGTADVGVRSCGIVGPPGVAILAQEHLHSIERDVESVKESLQHVADAVGGQVALHEQAVAYIEFLTQSAGVGGDGVVPAIADEVGIVDQ